MTVMSEGLLLNSKYIQTGREEGGFQALLTQLPLVNDVDEGNARSRGRPRFSVSKSQIEGLRDLGFTWSKIAAMIGVSRITLHRRIRELGLEEETRYSEIDEQELDVFVRTILALLPNSGEVMIRGALRGRGVRIQRSRLTELIQRVYPTRKQCRQRLQI